MDNNRKSISFTGNLTIFKNYTSAKNTSKCYRVFHIEIGFFKLIDSSYLIATVKES